MFQPTIIGDDLENYINLSESKNKEILPWAKKRIIWNNTKSKTKTKISVVYIHGFSASLGEIRPIPDILAKNLNANLFFTRLSGHGSTNSKELKYVDGRDWYLDVQEAIEIGNKIGDKILVVATSFGSTLVTEYLSQNDTKDNILASVFISPCFGIADWRLKLCGYTWSKFIYSIFFGEERVTTHRNSEERKWWSNKIPIESLINLMISVEKIWKSDFGKISSPAILIFTPKDRWISKSRIKKASQRWGGEISLVVLDVTKDVDNRNYHVILGDIKAPGLTNLGIEIIMNWLKVLLKST